MHFFKDARKLSIEDQLKYKNSYKYSKRLYNYSYGIIFTRYSSFERIMISTAFCSIRKAKFKK